MKDETFSYLPLIPLVSAYFFGVHRKETFRDVEGWYLPGMVPIVAAIGLYAYGVAGAGRLSPVDRHAVMSLSFVACCAGGIGLLYGPGAWRGGAFPLLFLFFMVPIPSFLLDRIVSFLQSGSAEVSDALFRLTGVPVYRDGFTFSLPGISIEVAKECSGIRSSLGLLLTGVIAGHLLLTRAWTKVVLILSLIPIALLKNGIRIVTLTLLGAYVDRRILGSELHKNGGVLFFLLALCLTGLVLWFLRRVEGKRDR